MLHRTLLSLLAHASISLEQYTMVAQTIQTWIELPVRAGLQTLGLSPESD